MKRVDAELTQRALQACRNIPEVDQLSEKLQVLWNSRMRSAAGRAFWPTCVIELNPRLLEISESEIRRTLLHELAHLLVYARYGTSAQPHGAEWKLFCANLGIPGETATHRLDLPRNKPRRRLLYRCPKCQIEVKRVRPMKKGAACLSCCRAYAKGRYSEHFAFELVSPRDES